MSRTFFIGDVHGCSHELDALLKEAQWSRDHRLVFVGDLVAKGPDSAGVVQRAIDLGALAVLGNHDAHFLDVRAGLSKKPQHVELAKSLTEAQWTYLDRLPLWLDFPELNVLTVHGGLVPGVDLSHMPRHLLLNMRSIDEEGKGTPRLEAGVPWASRWPGPRHVVFGHDAVRGLQQHPFATGLDTGCVYGRKLTGMWWPERRLVHVNARRAYQPVQNSE